jgi:exo-beta-1,3-glucanase (GH17 family)
VLEAIHSSGSDLKLFLGIYNISDTTSDVNTIISAVQGDWSDIITVSVGNEVVNDGTASVSTVVSTTSGVREQLRAYFFLVLNC